MFDKSDKKYLDQTLERVMKEQMLEYQRFSGAMFEELESQIALLAETVRGVLDQLKEMTEEMRVMRSDLKYKADREEFMLLENRVLKLERLAARR